MPTEAGLESVKTWSSASAESAPTTASTFFNPTFSPGVDSLEITLGEFTVNNSDNAATIQLWLKSRDEDGTEFVSVYDESLATVSGSSTTMYATPARVQITSVPAGSFFLRASSVTGTGAFLTGSAYARYYRNGT